MNRDQWEDIHHDDDHVGLQNRANTARNANISNRQWIQAELEAEADNIANCPVCNPKLPSSI